MIKPLSISELIKAPILDLPEGNKAIRLLCCGVPVGVNGMVHTLHVLNFAQQGEWSRALPSPVEGEIVRILTRHIIISN